MLTEAKQLHAGGLSWKRMEELGLEYRYLAQYLQKFPRLSASSPRPNVSESVRYGRAHLSALTDKLQTEIWRYAKRQMTWFKRDNRIKWFTPSDSEKINDAIKIFLR